MITVLTQFDEGFVAKFAEFGKGAAVGSVHEVDEVAGEFEGGAFESAVFAGAGEEVETKVLEWRMRFWIIVELFWTYDM